MRERGSRGRRPRVRARIGRYSAAESGAILWGYVFIAPAVIMYLIFQAWPILRGLFMAFSDYRWMVPATQGLAGFNGLDNWVEMFQDETFWASFLDCRQFQPRWYCR